MERLRENQTRGLSAGNLRGWGMFFVAAGVIGRALLQRELLGVGLVTGEELLQLMQNSEAGMILATMSLVLQALETCAIPVFALLLVEGFQRTSSFRNYFLRVLGTALLSEIPYNLALSDKFLDFGSRNPMFGLVLALLVLYFYKRYEVKSAQNVVIKLVVTMAGLLWPLMISAEHGTALIAAVCILWAFRRKALYRNFAGVSIMALCSILSPFYLAAPMGFLAIHFYNNERGSDNRWVNYLFYPVMLLIVGLVGKLLL
jgi:hypothetical protein